jgi:hypothetical protein
MKKFLIGVALVAAVGAVCSDARQGRTQPLANERAATTVQVTATEYAFDVPSDVIGGVVEMRFTNNGAFPHEFALSRIEEGRTEADVQVALEGQAPPKWAEDIGGVPTLSPGESITVTRTLQPGSYVLLCFLPGDHGMPHALMGMYELFTVTGDAGVALPQSDAIITATDDALRVPALTTGEQTVKFENGGTDPVVGWIAMPGGPRTTASMATESSTPSTTACWSASTARQTVLRSRSATGTSSSETVLRSRMGPSCLRCSMRVTRTARASSLPTSHGRCLMAGWTPTATA